LSHGRPARRHLARRHEVKKISRNGGVGFRAAGPCGALLAGMCVAAALLAGCNIVGPAYYLIHGPEKVKKQYTLDKAKPTVIFIDDRANRVPRRTLRLAIAQEAEKNLLKSKTVVDMISAESAMLAAGHDRYEQPIPIAEIGRAVKAEQMIYATVDGFTLSPDGQTYSPVAQLRVKVIDATSDKRLWPTEDGGFPITVHVVSKTSPMPTSTSSRYQAEDELAKQIGLELAWLFIDHEAEHDLKGGTQ
jgi:hypothetical protein